mgnify:CR=1 FL=1
MMLALQRSLRGRLRGVAPLAPRHSAAHRLLCSSVEQAVPKTTITIEVEEKLGADANQLDQALLPREIVEQLDRYIIGQADAKRAVSVALRACSPAAARRVLRPSAHSLTPSAAEACPLPPRDRNRRQPMAAQAGGSRPQGDPAPAPHHLLQL